MSGRKYIDSTTLDPKMASNVKRQAMTAGVPVVTKEQGDALQQIDNAKLNLDFIQSQLMSKLPKDAAGRVVVGPSNKIQEYLQTDDVLGAANTYRTAAIQLMRAAAGSKGLRINQAEIKQSVDNDIPRITDTVGVAQRKMDNMRRLLDNAEQSMLVRDRSQASGSKPVVNLSNSPALQGQYKAGDVRTINGVDYKRDAKGNWSPQ
jgi:hypothetical protein